MGLEGTLRVFSLSDIFQVLGLQKKSGVLTVDGDGDTVTISFLGGQVVSAESAARRLENRIGTLLVRAGKITQAQLDHVLQVQKESQQRLGFLLIRERLVSPEDLREALRLQISRIVSDAFRWDDGRFRFSQDGPIDYDPDHMSPVPAESVLLQAAQMRDEWPALEKRVRSKEIVFRRVPGVEALQLVTSAEGGREGTLVVPRPEAETWRLVNGERNVADILERAFLSDFEVYRGLADLVGRNLIEEGRASRAVSAPAPVRRAEGARSRTLALWAACAVLLAVGAYRLPRNGWNLLLRSTPENHEITELLKSVSLGRLNRLERAVRVCYDSSGQYPRSLEDLVVAGILRDEDLRDPFGRPYRYILRSEEGKFGLYGRNARGAIDLDLSFDRTLAPVAEIHPARSKGRQPDKRPGVQLID